jgi:hypothetical protein
MGTRRCYWEVVRHRRAGGVPAAALARSGTIAALAQAAAAGRAHALRVACLVELPVDRAVDPAPVVDAARRLADVGVALDAWPQLAADDDRYLNTRTAPAFRERLLPLVDALPAGAGLALDVEPRARMLRAAWTARRSVVAAARAAPVLVDEAARNAVAGAGDLRALIDELAARGRPIHVAVAPPFLPVLWGPFAARVLACPSLARTGVVEAAMCYAPMMDARAGRSSREQRAFAAWARRHRAQSDAIVLGPLSVGVLDDEPVYERRADFVADLGVARALGFSDVACFSLEGLLYGRAGIPSDDGAPTRADWSEWADALLAE